MQSTFKERTVWRLYRWLRLDLGVAPDELRVAKEQRDMALADCQQLQKAYHQAFKALVNARIELVGLRARLDAREVRLRHYERQLAGKKQGRRGLVPTPKVTAP